VEHRSFGMSNASRSYVGQFLNNAPKECGHFPPGGLPVEFSHCIPLGRAVIDCPVANSGCLAGSLCAQKLIAEIFEIGGDTEVTALYKLDYRLQVVFLFSGDANLSILQLALHFESL